MFRQFIRVDVFISYLSLFISKSCPIGWTYHLSVFKLMSIMSASGQGSFFVLVFNMLLEIGIDLLPF